MILVTSPSKPFVFTAKNTPRRQETLNSYEDEIDALYRSVDTTSQTNIPAPSSWDIDATTDFVRTVVHSVVKHSVTDADDLFQHGCDRCSIFIFLIHDAAD